MRAADVIERRRAALDCWHGSPRRMMAAHRHDDIEVNLCESGELVYLFGGERVVVTAGTIAVFWAARPHQLINAPEHELARWLTVPLPTVLRWDLPHSFVTELLRGRSVLAPPSPARAVDALLMAQWEIDLASGSPRLESVAGLEIQARMFRLAVDALTADSTAAGARDRIPLGTPKARSTDRDEVRVDVRDGGRAGGDAVDVVHAASMARYVVAHFTEDLRVADVAAVVGLNPGYAMTVFRRVIGRTIIEYLTQCRVAESQRLLITTELPVARVGLATGFGSQSQFYAAFIRACGVPPARYRREVR